MLVGVSSLGCRVRTPGFSNRSRVQTIALQCEKRLTSPIAERHERKRTKRSQCSTLEHTSISRFFRSIPRIP
jgi:hypothetical protein